MNNLNNIQHTAIDLDLMNWDEDSFTQFGISQGVTDLDISFGSMPGVKDEQIADTLGWNNLLDMHEYYSSNM